MTTPRLPMGAILLLLGAHAMAQETAAPDSTGLPGDHFSLQGALELFKNTNSLEEFEKALNTEDNKVNDLDLDGDGQIDYVRVETVKDGDAVAIMLRVPVSKTESQDVAVIELEKTGPEEATVQIRGDDDLYPENTIIEPFAENEQAAPTKGPSAPELVGVRVVVNVWGWGCPRWCFGPSFVVWSSPWYWGYYPPWWRPWHPHPWRVWWGWGAHYRVWYRPWHTCRVVHAQAIYAPRRVRSVVVSTRYAPAHEHYRATRVAHPAAAPAHRAGNSRPANPARTAPKARPAAPAKAPAARPKPATAPAREKAAPKAAPAPRQQPATRPSRQGTPGHAAPRGGGGARGGRGGHGGRGHR